MWHIIVKCEKQLEVRSKVMLLNGKRKREKHYQVSWKLSQEIILLNFDMLLNKVQDIEAP